MINIDRIGTEEFVCDNFLYQNSLSKKLYYTFSFLKNIMLICTNIRRYNNRVKLMERTCDYWFTIEPYVFIGITNKHVLLYNTLDGITIESDKDDVVNLLHELVRTESCVLFY